MASLEKECGHFVLWGYEGGVRMDWMGREGRCGTYDVTGSTKVVSVTGHLKSCIIPPTTISSSESSSSPSSKVRTNHQQALQSSEEIGEAYLG